MTAQTTHFNFDPVLAKQLDFLYLAVGGSRIYQPRDLTSGPKTACTIRDWDFIGLVETKNDIVSLVLHKRTQLCALLGIIHPEHLSWETLKEGGNQEDWEVLRFAGWAEDRSKRSLKICSRDHLLSIASEPAIRHFGVLSARLVRFTHRYHPHDGYRIFVYQPLKLTENLFILYDADFLRPEEGDITAVNPGVTCDLFLTSDILYEICSDTANPLKAALLHKWRAISKASCVANILPLFYRYSNFNSQYTQRLQNEFTRVTGASSAGSSYVLSSLPPNPSSAEAHETESRRTVGLQNDYRVLSFMPMERNFWSPRYASSIPNTAPAPSMYKETFKFREASEQYRPSAFTSNSKGVFGEICLSTGQEWQQVFVKKGPHIIDELIVLPDVLRYFPPSCVQQLVALDKEAEQLFFSLFKGKTLNQVRLDYYGSQSFLNNQNPLDVVDWFLAIELRRAEHVSDAYRRTITMDPIAAECAEQRIHRFYHARLESDIRFLEFYSEHCLEILGIHNLKEVSTLDFLNTPLTINGAPYPPLRHYLDRAKKTLDPGISGGLSDLPVAFGLGDGHGGNFMVTQEYFSPKTIYIDYEVSGFHCPFLDMAKSIYNDGFFNVLYADLLCSDASDKSNKAGVMVSWDIHPEAICIDYNVNVDTIGKSIATTKLEYVLRPVFELLGTHSPWKAKLAEDVLGYALLTCALLTRNFAKRPDIFFLNLAVGVRLTSSLREVFSEVFGWHRLPVIEPPTRSLVPIRNTEAIEKLATERPLRWLEALLSSSYLKPEEVLLKRAEETFQLQQYFSQRDNESPGTIMHRITHARYLGMKIAAHTCIRESLFAEPRIDHHFAYSDILALRSPAKLLIDVGCCMGTDIRKLILDGYPPECILGLDVESRFFKLGLALYNEDENTSKIRFRQADMLDPKFAEKNSDLENMFHFVHTSNVIHLFGFHHQEIFFRNLVHLAKPEGIIWGRQVGLAEDGDQSAYKQPDGKGARFTIMEFRDFCLRTTGWNVPDTQFEAQLVEYDELRAPRLDKKWVLQWSIHVPRSKATKKRILTTGEA